MDTKNCRKNLTSRFNPPDREPASVPLSECPRTAIPVPWLTSIHATPGRGDYGDPAYRGNCSGLLIRDLLVFFGAKRTLDVMEGGGTCRDVCKELGIDYVGRDLKSGFDSTRGELYEGVGKFDFIWLHPPYWNMARYNAGDGRCLSSAPSIGEFVTQLRSVLRNCRGVLAEGGKLAVLMGDGKHEAATWGFPFAR
jgi:hypothetical protein